MYLGNTITDFKVGKKITKSKCFLISTISTCEARSIFISLEKSLYTFETDLYLHFYLYTPVSLYLLGIQPLFGDEPVFSPGKSFSENAGSYTNSGWIPSLYTPSTLFLVQQRIIMFTYSKVLLTDTALNNRFVRAIVVTQETSSSRAPADYSTMSDRFSSTRRKRSSSDGRSSDEPPRKLLAQEVEQKNGRWRKLKLSEEMTF